jgi:transposase
MAGSHLCAQQTAILTNASRCRALWRAPRRIGESANLSSHRVRDWAHGADPFPRVEPPRFARGLRGEPAGLHALKSLATHKTDRNDARGLAHLARTGFFKPVHVKSLQARALRSLIIARKKLVGQRVTLENQIRGLAVVFGVRLPRALTVAFIDNALKASEGIAGLSVAMRGLIAARTAVMTAVAAIDADMRRMTRASAACRRLMTIPGAGQLTALTFVAAIDDPSRIRRSRDIGAYLGLVPRRYQSGEVDYVGGISKCGDRRVRTLLYEPITYRYKGQLKLKDWAFAIAKQSAASQAFGRPMWTLIPGGPDWALTHF